MTYRVLEHRTSVGGHPYQSDCFAVAVSGQRGYMIKPDEKKLCVDFIGDAYCYGGAEEKAAELWLKFGRKYFGEEIPDVEHYLSGHIELDLDQPAWVAYLKVWWYRALLSWKSLITSTYDRYNKLKNFWWAFNISYYEYVNEIQNRFALYPSITHFRGIDIGNPGFIGTHLTLSTPSFVYRALKNTDRGTRTLRNCDGVFGWFDHLTRETRLPISIALIKDYKLVDDGTITIEDLRTLLRGDYAEYNSALKTLSEKYKEHIVYFP